jgi:hypothetical protein
MVHANFDGLTLRLTLTAMEKCAVGRGDLRLAREQLVTVEHRPDAWDLLPPEVDVLGVGYPGMVALGTLHRPGARTFCLVHGRDPGLAVTLRDQPAIDRLVFSVPRRDAWPLFARLRELTTDAAADREQTGS